MEWKSAAALGTLKEYGKLRVELNDTPVLLIYYDKNVYALHDNCPHMKASLYKGSFSDGVVTCARHNAKINVENGEILEKPKMLFMKVPAKKATTYETKTEEGEIFVKI